MREVIFMFKIQLHNSSNFLDIQNGMTILDLCSAPGGKATHILERFDVDLTAMIFQKKN